tara:strand:+ start:2475 stop:3338 length:864 start_codon:yes stop_codon:yes gene_type:complete
MHNQKIILGTAQLNNIYGISNNNIKLNNHEFFKIIKLMKIKKIYKLDCAESYRNFHTLQKFLNKKFKITNKIVFNYEEKTDLNTIKQKFIKLSKNNLEVENLLIHNCDYISTKKFKKFYDNLMILKKLNYFKNIGFSCYKIKEIYEILKKFDTDLIQFPFNIFDQRLNNNSLIKKIKKKKIKIQIRSIFLQGLLLDKKVRKKIKYEYAKKLFNNYDSFLAKNKISEIKACIGFIKQYNFYDNIVLGVDTFKQFKVFLEIYTKYSNNLNYSFLSSEKSKIILPYLWQK